MHSSQIDGKPKQKSRDQNDPKTSQPLEKVRLPRIGTLPHGTNDATPNEVAAQYEENEDGYMAHRRSLRVSGARLLRSIGMGSSLQHAGETRTQEQWPAVAQKDS